MPPALRADLHTHSVHSDGFRTPSELAVRAAKLKLDAVALTDHDTASGVAEMAEAGKNVGVQVLPGIELSAYSDTEIHILGYNMDLSPNGYFCAKIKEFGQARIERMRKIIENLRGMGFLLDFEEVAAFAVTSVSRAHIAMLMARKGYVPSAQDAMELYLAEGRPAYVAFYRLPPEEAIATVLKGGGVPVLAHPGRLHMRQTEISLLLNGLRDAGLAGIESGYFAHANSQVRFFRSEARRLGLINTKGSDFHLNEKQPMDYIIDKKTAEVLGIR